MYCPKCGTQSGDDARFCISCGFMISNLAPGMAVAQGYGDNALGGLIPYKNAYALVSYYLGVFSIIPGFGILLAIPAIILGVMGLKFYKKNPAARGKTHAWAGILGGLIFGLGQIALIALLSIYG